MASSALREAVKKSKFVVGFANGRLIHTNLQLLYDCNFKCAICDFWRGTRAHAPRLSLDQVRLISEKLGRIGPQIVSIGGGEPLLHEQIDRVVETLAERHFPVMITNGWFVTPAIAERLFAAGIYEVSVSVDYADPDKHDAQRGVTGAHARAIEALATLERARVHPWQRVHMISVVMDDNLDYIEALIERCRSMGITYLVTLYSHGRGRLDRREIREGVSARLLDLKKRYPEFVQLRGYLARFDEAIRDGGVGPCHAGKSLLNIDSSGEVSVCIDRLDDPVGNIFTDDIQVLETRLLARQKENRCRSCWTSCRGAIETIVSGNGRLSNLLDYHAMTKAVSLSAGA
jgi:MoaA/NifB/PqqE/SkfB family radical SAM enzyme